MYIHFKETLFSTSARVIPSVTSFIKIVSFLYLLISTSFLLGIEAFQDNTVVDLSSGREVTEAVIRRIIRSEIFPEDFSFMLRVANVESKFGLNNRTYRPEFYGGIWQVDKEKLEKTKDLTNETTFPILKPLHNQIYSYFGIDWTQVEWEDLLKPLYSGLAARIFFSLTSGLSGNTPNPIPDTINRQANRWHNYYRPGEEGEPAKFIQESRFLQDAIVPCRAKLDLMIGIDSSGSVPVEKFDIMTSNVGNLITKTFKQGLEYTRIGTFLWSNVPFQISNIESDTSLEGINEAIKNARFASGNTRADVALKYGLYTLRNATQMQKGVPQVILLFMEGQSKSPIDEVIPQIKAENVTTIVVGIGKDVDQEELLRIGLGEKTKVFALADFDSLPDFQLRMSELLCSIPQKTLFMGEVYNDILLINETRTYIVQIDNWHGITIHVEVENQNGSVSGFWSYNHDMPSSSVNEGEIDADGSTFVPAKGAKTTAGLYATGLGTKKQTKRLLNLVEEIGENENNFPQHVYLVIKGIEQLNHYKVHIEEGDQDSKGDENGVAKITSNYVTISCFFIFTMFSILN